jgi:hypothetical protein
MNVKEGVRRLGILVGICGGLLGGFFANKDLQILWNIHNAHQRFENLMASAAMREVAKAALDTQTKEWVKERSEHSATPVGVAKDGIEEVTVDRTGRICSIELSTGESVQRVEPPSPKAYLLPLLYPFVGFLLPWGCIRVLTWVGSGFFVLQQ